MRLPRFINRLVGPPVEEVSVRVPLSETATDRSEFAEPAGPVEDASRQGYVGLLRTFGQDGDVRVGNPKEGEGFQKTTLESLIGNAASRHGVTVRALHDERLDFVPEGVDYYLAPNEEWERHFVELVNQADATFVLTTGPLELGESFRQELVSIREAGLAQTVVIVCPPDLDSTSHDNKDEVFRELSWPVPPAMPLVSYRDGSGRYTLHPSLGRFDDSLADRYSRALDAALGAVMPPDGRARRARR